MKIKSIEKLQELIDADIAWRKKELIEMRTLIHVSNNPTLNRAGLALLCAHFEGFIKRISNYYVVFVSFQRVPHDQLKHNFIALQMKEKLHRCSLSEKTSVHTQFVDCFVTVSNSTFFVKHTENHPIISTEANPSSEVFEEIVTSLGLSFALFETKRNYIDTDLLSNRHKVVHGEKVTIETEDFDETFTNITWIMETYRELVMDAAIKKQYLKSVNIT